jgi:5-methylcytosine-specific restriction enzyme A
MAPPRRALKPCARPGCPELVTHPAMMCEKHAAQKAQAERDARNSDVVMKWYRTQRWERIKIYMRSLNPLCQRICDNGQRCIYPSAILHHIISPRVRPDLMYDAENLICVCEDHHPNTEGEEDLTRYVKTVT